MTHEHGAGQRGRAGSLIATPNGIAERSPARTVINFKLKTDVYGDNDDDEFIFNK